MKKNSIFGLFLCLGILITACTKENTLTEEIDAPETALREDVENSDEILAVLDRVNDNLSALSNEEYREIADPLREELSENGELSDLETVALEDLFYLYEGILNYNHANLNAEEFTMTEDDVINGNDQMETFNYDFEVDVSGSNGSYAMSLNTFNSVYDEVLNSIEDALNSAQIPNIRTVDLDLTAISPSVASVSLSITTAKFPPVPQVFYPIPLGEVHGAINAGWCPSPAINVDAADFFRGHVNAYVSTVSPTQAYQIIMTMNTYSTWSKYKLFRNLSYSNYEVPYIWKDVVNSCIGDNSNSTNNNAIWSSWFGKTTTLINIPLNHLKNTVDSRFVFITTNLESYQKQGWHGPIYGSSQFWHEGNLQFGIKI